MSYPKPLECAMEVFGAIGPFDDALITGDMPTAVEYIRNMEDPVKAVQLVLATYCRSDSVIARRELDNLAEFLGVFEDDDEHDDPDA